MSIATLQIEDDSAPPPSTQSHSRVTTLANSFLSKSGTLNGGFMDLETEMELDETAEVIDLSAPSPSPLSPQLPFRLSMAKQSHLKHPPPPSTPTQTQHPNPIDKATSFSATIRHSPLSSEAQLKQTAQSLITVLKTLPLDPWDYADLVTDIDTAIHLHRKKDPYWARDVLQIGVSLSTAAVLSLNKSARMRKRAFVGEGLEDGEGEVRIRDTLDFFRVIVRVGEESCYRARKLIKCLNGGWYAQGVGMEALAERVCVEDRWWKKGFKGKK
ncbi:hypothetical protein BCR33DRAFT_713727 [Rhizoclosmatium globosum]|uniref:Uncharacterized protein n=1 Tax=Rhizoclosmatium globosum TaxID=329046 RepID=A0A1Y2CQR1_9FUNG|nr:hypothetical protein BCR33DRAFT_713727 [Rhizoclosmatium globosum]|eukprot:ORY49379.1 hypothetical protein BCR33DRAFT_713727 [Rhizoclosmatium globosum]